MQNIREIPTEQLEDMAWDLNLALREKLINFKRNPHAEQVNLEASRTEIASMLRLLDEYHSYLYLRNVKTQESPDIYFDPAQNNRKLAQKLDEYFRWRIKMLGSKDGLYSLSSPIRSRLNNLEDTDTKKFNKLFLSDLYKQGAGGEYRNHWHRVMVYGDNNENFIDFGDNHADISYVDVIASFKKRFETSFYAHSELSYGTNTLGAGITADRLRFPIHSPIPNHQQPHIVIGKEGSLKFDL